MRRLFVSLAAVLLLANTCLADAASEAADAKADAIAAAITCGTERGNCVARFGFVEPDPMEYPAWQDAEDKKDEASSAYGVGCAYILAAVFEPDEMMQLQLYEFAVTKLIESKEAADEAACIYYTLQP